MQQPNQGNDIVKKYGSVTNFYRQVAKDTGTTPDQVMETAEKMQVAPGIAPNPNQPQNTAAGGNASTPVSQVASGPVPLNADRQQAQQTGLQMQGMAPSQAVNQAAQNPQNKMAMAKGGQATQALQPPQQGQKGIQDLNLKEIMQLIATHPAMANHGTPGQGMKATDMASGGSIMPQNDPAVDAPNGSLDMGNLSQYSIPELRAGQMANKLNADGSKPNTEGVDPKGKGNFDKELQKATGKSFYATEAKKGGLLAMADGGNVGQDLGEDQISSYGPDGMPIVNNADGSTGYGDINTLLGRPDNSPTLATGEDPSNATSRNVANAPTPGVAMAKGGEDSPPGSLSNEVADDIPAQLSEGEFVFSADSTRYYGLKQLAEMQDEARQELAKMDQSGGIRTPGDGKNPDQQGGQFVQDQEPNQNFYNPGEMGQDDDDNSSPMAKAKGGPVNYGKYKGGLIDYASMGGAFGNLDPNKTDEDWDNNDKQADASQAKHEKSVADRNDKNEATDTEIQNPNQPKKLATGGLLQRNDAQARGVSSWDEDTDTGGMDSTILKPDAAEPQDENAKGMQYGDDTKNHPPISKNPKGKDTAKLKTGGLVKMATGGMTDEETQFKKGGPVGNTQYGRNNMVSAHPKGGSTMQDYDKGGIVSSKSVNLTPKKIDTAVPTGAIKMPSMGRTKVNGPHTDSTPYGLGKFTAKAKTGGLIRQATQPESISEY